MRTGRAGALSSVFLFSLAVLALLAHPAWTADAPASAKAGEAAPAGTGNPDDVLATVGDWKITRADMMREIENFKGSGGDRVPDFSDKENQKKFLQQLIEITLLEKKAAAANIPEKPELREQIQENAVALLANAYIRKSLGEAKVGKADIEEFYQKNKERFTTPTSYHLHQITLDSQEAADGAKKALEAKKSFAELAREKSTDKYKSSGGDRGFVALSELPPMVAAAVAGLAADQISAPIADGEGKFLLVKYSEKKEGSQKSLEEVSGEIERELKEQLPRQALEARLAELEKEFNFKLEPKALEVLRQGEFKPSDLDQVLFTIGTEAVKISALMPELERIPPFIRPAILGGEGLNDFVKQFSHRELVRRYVAKNFDALAKEFPHVLKDARRRVALKHLLDEKIGNVVTVSDDEIKDYYTQNLGEFAQPEQVRAHHILVDSEDKAKSLKEKIEKGEKFEELAKTESKCPSGKEGGDLGFFSKGQMVPEFDQVAQTAEIGKVVGPVKTQFGYHLIRVDERKAAGTIPLDEVKEQIRSRLLPQKQRAAFDKFLEDLKKEYPVKETGAL